MKKQLAAGMISSLAVLVMGAGPVVAQTTPTGKAAAIVEPSVVYISMNWTAQVWVPKTLSFGNPISAGYLSEPFTFGTRCTGFVINPEGYVATAGHCVDPGREEGAGYTAIANYGVWQWLEIAGLEATTENYNAAWEGLNPLGSWKVSGGGGKATPIGLEVTVQRGVAAGGVDSGEAMSARVVDYQAFSAGDVALLKVESPNPLPSVALADADSVDVGSEIISIGYPGAADEVTDATYEPTFQDGQINSEKTREGGQLPVWEISSDVSGGMSGGPTVDLQGRVVGINSFGHFQESFNYISPVTLLEEMLSQNGVEAKLGQLDTAYRNGLNAFFAGDMDRAAFELERVTQQLPGHVQAQEYLRKALAQGGDAEKGDPANQGNLMLIIGIAAAALLLIGGGLWFMLSRRKKAAPAPAGMAASVPPANGGAPAPAPTGGMAAPATGLPPAPPPPAPTPVAMPAQPVADTAGPNGEATAPAAPRARRSTTSTAKKATGTRSSAKSTAAKRTGTRAAANKVSGKYCPDCGNKQLASAKFCENCGHKF